ncbi:MAG: MaoC family dehydratase [Myxococcota bacterium]
MNLKGQRVRVGDLVHTAERAISPEVIAFYCDTFADRNPVYARESVAPPLLYHSEVYAHIDRWYLKKLVGNLHARQEWQLFAPLRAGSSVRTRSTVVDRYRKRDRDFVVNEVDFADESGRLLVRSRTHQSFLADLPQSGREAYVVDRDSAAKKERRAVGEGDGPELEPAELEVDLTTCWRFSGPIKNYHTDRDEAKKLGFPDVVVQGMLSTCLMSQVMGNAHGPGWLAGGRMDVKLVNVLWGGERVRARAKLQGESPEGTFTRREYEIWVEKDDAKRTVVTVGSASALLG